MSKQKLPKLAQGSTYYGTSNELIRNGKIVVPFISKIIKCLEP